MSDTPRTDEECIEIWTDPWTESPSPKDGPYVKADFARQLERELNEIGVNIKKCVERLNNCADLYAETRNAVDSLASLCANYPNHK